jgi:hypothetical protein
MVLKNFFKISGLLLLALSFSQNAFAYEEDIYEDYVLLDGYVGLGAALVPHLTSPEGGTRQNFRVEFARLRKHISLDARVGLGQDYSDFGGLFRVYRHFKFNPDTSSTGISIGAGLGAMYSQGTRPPQGAERVAFVDAIGAPFIRYVWDWRMGMGLGIDLEYQLVPLTKFFDDSEINAREDINDLRSRIFLGISLLFEV